ncbi:exonuclease domain-containing protein [Gorillibacterium sp. CAU 1737]|uniref:exonuclease domain-containing protein n=1 Tax=Gorillibacterium sp. CAU 1737 TaxID=3140362 RepID=UPI003260C42A
MKPIRPENAGIWHLYKQGGITPAITSLFNPGSAQHMAYIRSMMKEQRKQSLYDIELNKMEAVVFDLETTGFSPYNGDEIISIGAVAVVGEEVMEGETFYTPVNPKRKIPEVVVELTGITDEEASKGTELLHALSEFLDFIRQRVLLAHGSGHDKHFLNAALWKTSKTSLNHRLLDTMMIAKWLHPGSRSLSLDALLDYYDIPCENRHHALADSRMTARLWSQMLNEILGRGVTNLGDLYSRLSVYG